MVYNKEWVNKNPERFKEQQKKWRAANPHYTMYHNARTRAKEQGLPFTITLKDIVIPDKCPVLGITMKKGGPRDHCPSIDKVIPELGYTPDNIQIISLRANRLKSDGTLEELQKIVDYIIHCKHSKLLSSR